MGERATGCPRVPVVGAEVADHRQLRGIDIAFEVSLKVMILNISQVKVTLNLMKITIFLF